MNKPLADDCNKSDDKIFKLKRAICGQKHYFRAWNHTVNNYLQCFVYKRSKYEPCWHTKFEGNVKMIIALFVDDFFVFITVNQLRIC